MNGIKCGDEGFVLITPQERDAYVRDMESNTWCNPELVEQLKNKPLRTIKGWVLTDEHYQAIRKALEYSVEPGYDASMLDGATPILEYEKEESDNAA